jgi:hypothetical protein
MPTTIKDTTTGAMASVEARKQTPTGNALNVQIGPGDVISNIPVFIDFDHHQLHEGETHKAEEVNLTLGTGTVKYGITVPVFANPINGPHMVVSVDTYDGAALIQIYEGATFSGGTAMATVNRNRNSSATVAATTFKTGVTSTNGTLIDSFFVGGGVKTSGVNRQASEWILKSNTIYRVDVIGLGASTDVIVAFDFYEDLGV